MNVEKDLLTVNKYSRPGTKLKEVKGLVVHWVANPNTSAKANRNFFENRKSGKSGYGSAHYIIDLNGTVLQCIPSSELSYNCGAKKYKADAIKRLGSYPNATTLGIECTHTDWNGKMTAETYNSLVELCKDLCMVYKLDPTKDLYRHYDVTGKDCHKWFVDHPQEWEKFKREVANKMAGKTAENKGIIKFEYEGKKFEVEGIFKDGTNYTPARTLLEALGFIVGWDNVSKTVTIKKD